MGYNKGDKVKLLIQKKNFFKRIIMKIAVVEILMVKEMFFSTNYLVQHSNGKITWEEDDSFIEKVA